MSIIVDVEKNRRNIRSIRAAQIRRGSGTHRANPQKEFQTGQETKTTQRNITQTHTMLQDWVTR